jgi:hypothetical protein
VLAQQIQRAHPGRRGHPFITQHPFQQGGQRRVRRRSGQQRAGDLQGLGRPAELLVQGDRQPSLQLGGLRRGQGDDPLLPDRDQLLPALLAFQQPLQRRGGLQVRGIQPEQLLEVADRPAVLTGHVLGDVRGLAQQPLAPRGIGDGRQPGVVRVQQLRPALAHGQRGHQGLEHPLLIGRRRQHPGQQVGHLGGVFPEHVGGEAHRPVGQQLAHRRRRLLLQMAQIQIDELGGLARARGHVLQPFPGAVVAGIALELLQRRRERGAERLRFPGGRRLGGLPCFPVFLRLSLRWRLGPHEGWPQESGVRGQC